MKYKTPDWAVKTIIREDGIVEDVCEHGVGHPNDDWLKTKKDKSWGVHGCDGCCCGRKL